MPVVIEFNCEDIIRRFEDRNSLAVAALSQQILKDSNFYCPLKTGTLQKSAIINTVLGSGLVIWRTPYARRQYYGVNFDHSKSANPNACAKWFEAAKARKMKDWEKLVNDTIKNS